MESRCLEDSVMRRVQILAGMTHRQETPILKAYRKIHRNEMMKFRQIAHYAGAKPSPKTVIQAGKLRAILKRSYEL